MTAYLYLIEGYLLEPVISKNPKIHRAVSIRGSFTGKPFKINIIRIWIGICF